MKTKLLKTIQSYLKKEGINAKELATRAGVNHTILYRFLNESRSMRIETAEKIERAMK